MIGHRDMTPREWKFVRALFLIMGLLCLFGRIAYADDQRGPLLFGESDGDPDDLAPWKALFGAGSLTPNADGSVTVATSGAPTSAEFVVTEASASLSAEVAPSAANQIPNSTSSTAGSWTATPTIGGTITADGLTLSNDELVTWGSDTQTFNSTVGAFDFTDDLYQSQTGSVWRLMRDADSSQAVYENWDTGEGQYIYGLFARAHNGSAMGAFNNGGAPVWGFDSAYKFIIPGSSGLQLGIGNQDGKFIMNNAATAGTFSTTFGMPAGQAASLNFTLPPTDGDSGDVIQTDGNGVLTFVASAAASGDITAVGDVADGAAFNGTQGTTLTFNNAGGDGTFSYDGTSFTASHPLDLAAAGVRLSGSNGAMTMLGLGDDADEALTLNLNSTNGAIFSSSTGITEFDLGTIGIQMDNDTSLFVGAAEIIRTISDADLHIQDDTLFEDSGSIWIGGRDTNANTAWIMNYDTAEGRYPWALLFMNHDGTALGTYLNGGRPGLAFDSSFNTYVSGFIETTEIAAPATPAPGTGRIYIGTDGVANFMGENGVSRKITPEPRELWWPASATLPMEAADAVAPILKEEGTNLDQLVAAFDDATDEGRLVQFKVPADVDATGAVIFTWYWYPATAATNNVMWNFRYTTTGAQGENWDVALTTKAAAPAAGDSTQDEISVTTLTTSVSVLGWAANDMISGMIYRDANHASDTLSGDAYLIGFSVSIGRA